MQLKAIAAADALHLGLVAAPSCTDGALSVYGPAKRVAWLCNAAGTQPVVDPASGLTTFRGKITVGRKPSCNIVLEDRAISTTHCTIAWELRLSPGMGSSKLRAKADDTTPKQFDKSDNLQLTVTLVDSSTNGTYIDFAQLPRNVAVPIVPEVLSSLGNPVWYSPNPETCSETVYLGKTPAHRGLVDTFLPVMAFKVVVLASSPWEREITVEQTPYLEMPEGTRFPVVCIGERRPKPLVVKRESHAFVPQQSAPVVATRPSTTAWQHAEQQQRIESEGLRSGTSNEITRLRQEITDLRYKLQGVEDSRMKELAAARNITDEKCTLLSNQLQELSDSKEAIERELKAKIANLETERVVEQSRAAQMNQDLQNAENESKSALARIAVMEEEMKQLQKAKNQAQVDTHEAQTRLNAANEKLNSLYQEHGEEMSRRKEEHKSSYAALEAKYREKVDECEGVARKLSSQKDVIDDLSASLTKAEDQYKNLRSAFDEIFLFIKHRYDQLDVPNKGPSVAGLFFSSVAPEDGAADESNTTVLLTSTQRNDLPPPSPAGSDEPLEQTDEECAAAEEATPTCTQEEVIEQQEPSEDDLRHQSRKRTRLDEPPSQTALEDEAKKADDQNEPPVPEAADMRPSRVFPETSVI